ncbi:WxL domain-containing protein [Latilactobacillus sakei]|uniref:WxL domain-containing protein n=1 Tax=Latilactobacillus sakei TaxID=1599 RepID=UPI000B9D7765|nr:WxL domain-containing protein [Latilactobacillus sakei]BAX69149.1 putative cell surface protein [Latilactobacillus sakei]
MRKNLTALIVGCMTLIGFVYFQVNMSQAAKDIQKSETQMSSNKQSASQQSSKKESVIQKKQPLEPIQPLRTIAIDDGIHNWQEVSQATIESIPVGDKQTLNYTFGNDDGTLEEQKSADSSTLTKGMPPKMNIFLVDNGRKIPFSYFPARGLTSSYDYALTKEKDQTGQSIGDTSISRHFNSFKVYRGTDSKGQAVLKAEGQVQYLIDTYQVELVLRPSLKKPVIQQELYIANDSYLLPREAGIFFAKDTALNGNDGAPVYAQADNAGLSIANDGYKLFMNMNTADGPLHYMTTDFSKSGLAYDSSNYDYRHYRPATFSGVGLEADNLAEGGTDQIAGAEDATKILIHKKQVALDKQVRNETMGEKDYQTTTTVHPDDTIDYRIRFSADDKMTDKISTTELQDTLPKGLTLVPDSILIKYSDGTSEKASDLKAVKLHALTAGQHADIEYQVKVAHDQIPDIDLKNTVTSKTAIADSTTVLRGATDATVKSAKPAKGQITFHYIDWATGSPIGAKAVTVKGLIGKPVSEAALADVSGHQDPNQIRPANIPSYVPVDYTDQADLSTAKFYRIKDVDPLITATPQDYTFRYERSRLAMTVPADMNFNPTSDTQAERTYYLPGQREGDKKVPYGVEVSDYWGINDWQLGVSQTTQFTGQYTDQYQKTRDVQLDNAQLQFNNANFKLVQTDGNNSQQNNDQIESIAAFSLIPGDKPKTLVTYHKSGQYRHQQTDNKGNLTYDLPGYSIYQYRFGDPQTADYSIGLHVPQTTKRYQTHYQTTLKWHLTVAP